MTMPTSLATTDQKVDLLIEPMGGFHNYEIGPRPRPVRRMLPWYASNQRGSNGVAYAHRVRSGLLHTANHWWTASGREGNRTWISVRLFCGQNGSSGHGSVYAEPPGHTIVCATCEARAVGSGMPALAITLTRPISFRPRHRTQPEWSSRYGQQG